MLLHQLAINNDGTVNLILAFSALTLLVGRQEGHLACRKYGGGMVEVGTG